MHLYTFRENLVHIVRIRVHQAQCPSNSNNTENFCFFQSKKSFHQIFFLMFARLCAIFHAILSFLQHLLYVITIQLTIDRIDRMKKPGIYFMIETAEFFSVRFIAHSHPQPS